MLLVSIKEGRRGRNGGKEGKRSPSSFLLPSKTKFGEGGREGERVFHSLLVRIWSLPEKERGNGVKKMEEEQ